MVENLTGISNSTMSSISTSLSPLSGRVLFVQVLVAVFLYINGLMIFTFFRKEAFRTDTRYVLFAHMLFVDSSVLVTTNFATLLIYHQLAIPYAACMLLTLVMIWLQFFTPLTLVAMCLERYVAVCRPLRHADISTPRTRLVGLLLIWTCGSVPGLVIVSSFVALAPFKLFSLSVICSLEALIVVEWQRYLQTAVNYLFFLLMLVIIAFTYVKVSVAAHAASSNNKQSSSKGMRTVALHAIQLFLCLIQLLCSFVEMSMLKISITLYVDVRFFNFVVFLIAPRCLSPLIYGLRDQKFFQALKRYAVFSLTEKVQPTAVGLSHTFNSVLRNEQQRPVTLAERTGKSAVQLNIHLS